MTYNVHSCVGTDRKLSVARVAKVIKHCSADFVCLQELDVRRKRTGAVDQAFQIAEILEMYFHFHPAINVAEEQYGDAILSRHPLKLMRAAALPGLPGRHGWEPRGALWVSAEIDGVQIQLINTHLGMAARERHVQVAALTGPDWLGHADCRGPIILCGDLNAVPWSRAYRKLCKSLRDAQLNLEWHRPKATFPSRFPILRIDHVFLKEFFEVVAVSVPNGRRERIASDHLPLLVDLALTPRLDESMLIARSTVNALPVANTIP